ncbi:hypothetical protein GGX14DRAFT_397634 [Mycena pura]|uniref:CFEM domain-containing protein n=1 Tax=Mycena pura TaxID=153505 RepID=A0AAD6VAE7_9AGAR|nr:hypothetical protein GGX14DRAFT_397634 [Mycena pura]
MPRILTALGIVLLPIFSAVGTATNLPQCAIGCARESVTNVGCDVSLSACLCETLFSSTVLQCTASCYGGEQAQVETILANMCSAVSSNFSPNISTVQLRIRFDSMFPPPFGNADISPLPPTSSATPIPSPISVSPIVSVPPIPPPVSAPIPAPPNGMPPPAALISTPAPVSGGGAASMPMELPATSVISSSSATAPIVLATPVSQPSSSSPGITPILLSTSASLPNSNSSAAPSTHQSLGAAEATLVRLMSVFGAVIGVTMGIWVL